MNFKINPKNTISKLYEDNQINFLIQLNNETDDKEDKYDNNDADIKSCFESGACGGIKIQADFLKENANEFRFDFKLENDDYVDFGENLDAAFEWGDKYDEKILKPNLKAEEKNSINVYTRGRYQDINAMLFKYKRNLPELNQLESLSEKNTLEIIKTIDKIFEKKNITAINRNTFVYRRLTEEQMGMPSGSLRADAPWKELNQEVVVKLQQQFEGKTFDQHGFMSSSLSQDPHPSYQAHGHPILFKISLPRGNRAIYIEEISAYNNQQEVLIDRGYQYKYEKMEQTYNSKGWKYLKISVSLVKKIN